MRSPISLEIILATEALDVDTVNISPVISSGKIESSTSRSSTCSSRPIVSILAPSGFRGVLLQKDVQGWDIQREDTRRMNLFAQSRVKLEIQAKRENINPPNAFSSRRVYNDAALSDAICIAVPHANQANRKRIILFRSVAVRLLKPKYNALDNFEVTSFLFYKLLSF